MSPIFLSPSLLMMGIALFATALFTGGCRGYEDGPAVSLHSVKKRLINTWWHLDHISIDGIEDPSYGDSILIGRGEQFSRRLFSPETFGIEDNVHIEAISGKRYPGYYDLKDGYSEILFNLGSLNNYKILRLTKKEFHVISTDSTNPLVFIAFKKG